MKVTVTKYLNVRIGKPSLNAPCYQYLAPGSEIEVDGQLYKGEEDDGSYEGVDTWYKDEANNFYWSGGVETHNFNNEYSNNLRELQDSGKRTFRWFNHMNIEEIWAKYKTQGENVKVAILDTGYANTVTDLSGRISKEKIIIDVHKYPNVFPFVISDQSKVFHGTRCASIVGSANSSGWLVGIAPRCELLVGKMSIDREFYLDDYLINGIEWAISNGAEIISVSYALPQSYIDDFERIQVKIDNLMNNKDVLIFAASGNTGGNFLKGDRYPASFNGIESIGASTFNDKLSLETIISEKTVIHAPGENIESFGRELEPTPLTGTSFSTPIVAGITALTISYLKSKYGIWNKQDLLKKIYGTGTLIPDYSNKKVINPLRLFESL